MCAYLRRPLSSTPGLVEYDHIGRLDFGLGAALGVPLHGIFYDKCLHVMSVSNI